jgi:hypothetical protein
MRIPVMNLPQVHDIIKQGFITCLTAVAREKCVPMYVGNGLNRRPAAHRFDTAHLYCLALQQACTARHPPVSGQVRI